MREQQTGGGEDTGQKRCPKDQGAVAEAAHEMRRRLRRREFLPENRCVKNKKIRTFCKAM